MSGADHILLHACCGPCASVAVPAWRAEGLQPEALFCNPSIQPETEYERRLQAMQILADALRVPLTLAEREVPSCPAWLRGDAARQPAEARCRACVGFRLQAAARETAARGLPRFSTTLSVSPYQRHDIIRQAGEEAAADHDVEFVYLDLRGAYARSFEQCRRLGLYRQRYCGCAPSKWDAWHERWARRKLETHAS